MKFIILFVSLLLCLQRSQSTPDRFTSIETEMVRTGFSGAVCVTARGQVVFRKASGLADAATQTANSPETVFHIGSLSKPITAAVVLRLVEQGRMRLTDKVAEYLPEAGLDPAITVQHLLTHTSGIGDYTESDYRSLRDGEHSHRELVALIATRRARSRPGEKYFYSTMGYVVLGGVIERVTGRSLQQVIADQIAAPLSLKATGYLPDRLIDRAAARGYRGEKGYARPATMVNPSMFSAGGGMHATVDDLAIFGQSLLSDHLLQVRSREQIFQPHAGKYGYGWVVDERLGQRCYWHNGRIEGFSAFLVIFPEAGTVIAVASNNESHPEKLAATIARQLFPGSDQPQ